MSERKFEQFLVFFRGLLRVPPAQRDAIAAELLDHLQERLAELTDTGVSHDKAVQLALEEFEDAAGMAAQFVLVVQQQRRRKIMKWTAGTSLIAVVAFLFLLSWWPSDAVRGPGAVTVVAQEAAPIGPLGGGELPIDAPPDDAPPPAGGTDSPTIPAGIVQTESRLSKTTSAGFDDVPLRDFLDFISESAGVDFYIDRKSLTELGTTTETPISIHLKNVRYDRLLDVVCKQADVVWLVRDGYILVTTEEALSSQLEIRVYNCRDLVGPGLGLAMGMAAAGGYGMEGVGMMGAGGSSGAMGGMGAPGIPGMGMGMPGGGMMPSMGMPGGAPGGMDSGMGMGEYGGMMGGYGGAGDGSNTVPNPMEKLIKVITATVVPDSWMDAGGTGSIEAYYGGLLVVNHDSRAHAKIEQLLTMLREASRGKPGSVVRR